jgi:hypothetical protein
MHLNFRHIILTASCMLSVLTVFSQKAFREGTVEYAVTMEPPANQEGLVQHTGVYTITVKDKQLRKELKLDNGFNNVLIIDAAKDTKYVLKEMQGKSFAIQLDEAQNQKRKERYEGCKLKEKGAGGVIAGFASKKGVMTYKNGNVSEVYYTQEIVTDEMVFDQFPGTQIFPLEFTTQNENGMNMHFRATKVLAEPVESIHFRIPQNYKIISNEEYRQLSKR